jgi:hypothetical protein
MDINPFSILSRWIKKDVTKVNGVAVQGFSSGTAGTEIYGGYLQDEPLEDLQGKKGAEQYNKMRRGDGVITMALRAVKLPIRSAQWMVSPDDESPEAKAQSDLFSHILFKDLGKPWTRFTGEALTFVDFGYSMFEKTFKPVLNHPKFGPYVGVKSLGFRGQRTIERWIVDHNGNLLSIEQQAYGDTGRIVQIDNRFLIHFCPDQEGDNFEGISFLRACYGSWFRKNLYLKLLAAGIEKYAIPVPILTVPSGKENSVEYENALRVLKRYTSNQVNYITKPAGWELEVKVTTLDPQKIRDSIKDENQEMVNSFLAGFLMLGQTNTGSHALGSTLGDFFGTAVQFIGDHICEVMNAELLNDLVKLNFPGQELKCKLKVEGIKDSASAAFAEVLVKLVQSRSLKPDPELEKFVREKYKLPVAQVMAEAEIELDPTDPTEETKLSESSKPNQSKLIRKSAQELRAYIEAGLTFYGVNYIERMKRAYSGANGNAVKISKVPNDTEFLSFNDYKEILTSISMIQSAEAVAPIKSNMKLAAPTDSEKINSLMTELTNAINDYESTRNVQSAAKIGQLQRALKTILAMARGKLDLSRENIAAIRSRVGTLSETQMGDLKKKIDLQYQSSVGSTDSERTLFNDLEQARLDFNSSPVIHTGPDLLASQNINESILKETEGEPEVESYTFVAVDDDSTSDICAELNGRTFSKDDPDLFRYHPPLHHNCRSYMAVNLKSFKGNPEISKDPLELTKGAQGDITLSEELHRQIYGNKKVLDRKAGML